MSMLVTIMYVILIPIIGYYFVTPVFLLILLWVGGMRRSVALIGTTIGFMAFAYGVLGRLLGIDLNGI